MSKKFNKVMHFNDIENAYTNHQYPDAECMLSDTNNVPDSMFTVEGVKLIPKKVTENGTYYASQDGANGYDEVIVDVEGSATPVLRHLVCNYNGTFLPEEGVDGFDVVTTNIHPANPYVGNFTENQTIHVDGEYNGVDITVNVPPEEIGTNIKYLCYAKFEGTDDGTLFTNFPLDVKEYAGYNEYLSYDETNKCLTVLTDFQAILVPWIVNYQVGGNRAIMGVKLNGDWIIHRMVAPSTTVNSLGCISNSYLTMDSSGLAELNACTNGMYISLHTGDTISIQKPIDHGYAHCYLKVYRIFDSNSTSDTFMSSVVNTTDTDTYLNQIVGGNIRLDNRTFTANGTYAPVHDGYKNVTVAVQPDMPLNRVQISSISNKYMGAISTSLPIETGYYAISHYNSDQIAGGTNLAIVKIDTVPTTLTLGGLSNFRLNVTSNSVEVDNYDGSAKDVYMSIVKIPDNAICVKPD